MQETSKSPTSQAAVILRRALENRTTLLRKLVVGDLVETRVVVKIAAADKHK